MFYHGFEGFTFLNPTFPRDPGHLWNFVSTK